MLIDFVFTFNFYFSAASIDESAIGGNASAEAAPEDTEDGGASQVIDIVDGPRLVSVPAMAPASFKDFRAQMKPFVKGNCSFNRIPFI